MIPSAKWSASASRQTEPDITDWITAVSSGLTALVVLIALIIAIWQVIEARRARHGEAFFDVSRRWDEDALMESRAAGAQASTPAALRAQVVTAWVGSLDQYEVLVRVPNFFEDLAIMVERGILSFDDVQASLGSVVVAKWKEWETSVHFVRAVSARPTVYENFQRLAQRMDAALIVRERLSR